MAGNPSTYHLGSWLFLRGLGAIYLIAFGSFWIQYQGLVGDNGIYPISDYLAAVADYCEGQADISCLSIAPSLLWLGSSNAALTLLLSSAALSSILLLSGALTKLSAIGCWLCYLSLVTAVPQFLNFQWDSLLLETGLLGILFAPWKLWENPKAKTVYSSLSRGLIAWLLFRLMFESGYVKLNSFGPNNENTWWDLTALDYHYFTQPIPHGMSWHFHHLPDWFDNMSLCIMFAIELVIPFFIFAPRRIRTVALILQILLQLLIMLTGNFGFFNLLTCLLCIPLLADQSFPKCLRNVLASPNHQEPYSIPRWLAWSRRAVLWPIAAVILVMSTLELGQACQWIDLHQRDPTLWSPPESILSFHQTLAPYRSINGYGLFRVMTTERPEIIIAGSDDGITWKPYLFKWKPVHLEKLPGCAIPHMPRLDWQMWFAALNYHTHRQFRPWFARFMRELKNNNNTVTALLEHNPFAEQAPQYIRVELYLYTYTSLEKHRKTGHLWERKRLTNYTLTL